LNIYNDDDDDDDDDGDDGDDNNDDVDDDDDDFTAIQKCFLGPSDPKMASGTFAVIRKWCRFKVACIFVALVSTSHVCA